MKEKMTVLLVTSMLVASGWIAFAIQWNRCKTSIANRYRREYELSILLAKAIRSRDSLAVIPPRESIRTITKWIDRITTRTDTLQTVQWIYTEEEPPYIFLRSAEVKNGILRMSVGVGPWLRVFEYPLMNTGNVTFSGTFDSTNTVMYRRKRFEFPMSVGVSVIGWNNIRPAVSLTPFSFHSDKIELRLNFIGSQDGLFAGGGFVPFPRRSRLVVGVATPVIGANSRGLLYVSAPFTE